MDKGDKNMVDGRYHNPNAVRIGVCIPKTPAMYWRKVYEGLRDRALEYESRGVPIWLMMRYTPLQADPENKADFFEWLHQKQPDGLILFPKGRAAYLRETALHIPTTVLGVRTVDLMDQCGYVGTDPDGEGKLAAEMLLRHRPDVRHIAIVRPNHRYFDYTTAGRRWGFCDALISQGLGIDISDLFIDFQSKVSAAMIARSLSQRYTGAPLDCVYCTEGYVDAVCQGLSKARRAQWPDGRRPFAGTFCIGHEIPTNAPAYIEARLLAGCLSQDAYAYGRKAMEQTVDRCLDRGKASEWDFIPPNVEWFL